MKIAGFLGYFRESAKEELGSKICISKGKRQLIDYFSHKTEEINMYQQWNKPYVALLITCAKPYEIPNSFGSNRRNTIFKTSAWACASVYKIEKYGYLH